MSLIAGLSGHSPADSMSLDEACARAAR